MYSGFQSTVGIVDDNNSAQWALRQVVCGLWPIALLRQMEETPHHARRCRQTDLQSDKTTVSSLLLPPPICQLRHLFSLYLLLLQLS